MVPFVGSSNCVEFILSVWFMVVFLFLIIRWLGLIITCDYEPGVTVLFIYILLLVIVKDFEALVESVSDC